MRDFFDPATYRPNPKSSALAGVVSAGVHEHRTFVALLAPPDRMAIRARLRGDQVEGWERWLVYDALLADYGDSLERIMADAAEHESRPDC